MHSSDIAFKPNDDGWGYTKRYANGWDRIFAKSASQQAPSSESPPTSAAESPTPPVAANQPPMEKAGVDAWTLAKRRKALKEAHEVGALSDALFDMALQELEKGAQQ